MHNNGEVSNAVSSVRRWYELTPGMRNDLMIDTKHFVAMQYMRQRAMYSTCIDDLPYRYLPYKLSCLQP
jgi:hypothetical protein